MTSPCATPRRYLYWLTRHLEHADVEGGPTGTEGCWRTPFRIPSQDAASPSAANPRQSALQCHRERGVTGTPKPRAAQSQNPSAIGTPLRFTDLPIPILGLNVPERLACRRPVGRVPEPHGAVIHPSQNPLPGDTELRRH